MRTSVLALAGGASLDVAAGAIFVGSYAGRGEEDAEPALPADGALPEAIHDRRQNCSPWSSKHPQQHLAHSQNDGQSSRSHPACKHLGITGGDSLSVLTYGQRV